MSNYPGSPLEGDRSEILTDFQAVTGLDDVGLALHHLEAANWNLMDAIHRVLPQDTQTLPSERLMTPEEIPLPVGMELDKGLANLVKQEPGMSTASSSNGFRAHGSRSAQVVPSSKRTTTPLELPPPRPVTSAVVIQPENASTASNSDNEIEDVDLTDSFVDDDDDFDLPAARAKKRLIQSMITDNIEDEVTGTLVFSESFANRYGPCHPMFFLGTLEGSVREACGGRPKDRKLLAIYLHHDQSVLSNIFCSQGLCAEGIVNVLINNFIVWGWDVTHDSNRNMFLAAVQRSFGQKGEGVIRSIPVAKYPIIVIVSRNRGTTDICSVIDGATGVDELMIALLHAVEEFRSAQHIDMQEEQDRLDRERVIQEQDAAYNESLRVDMAKEQAKIDAEAKKKQEEDERIAALARIETEKKLLAKSLAPEPSADTTEKVCTLRCRFPDGKVGSRKFFQSGTLALLYAYLLSEGYSTENYKVLFSYPKKDLTQHFKETQQLGSIFSTQETLIVEER